MTPPSTLGQEVIVVLSNGVELVAYWDGQQWWSGHSDYAEDFPVANDYVVDWRARE